MPAPDLTPLDWSDAELDRLSDLDTDAAREEARAWAEKHLNRNLAGALDAPEEPQADEPAS